MSRRERRVLEPAREQLKERLESLGEEISDTVHEKVDALEQKISGQPEQPEPVTERFPTHPTGIKLDS
jgi:hypothetical protein